MTDHDNAERERARQRYLNDWCEGSEAKASLEQLHGFRHGFIAGWDAAWAKRGEELESLRRDYQRSLALEQGLHERALAAEAERDAALARGNGFAEAARQLTQDNTTLKARVQELEAAESGYRERLGLCELELGREVSAKNKLGQMLYDSTIVCHAASQVADGVLDECDGDPSNYDGSDGTIFSLKQYLECRATARVRAPEPVWKANMRVALVERQLSEAQRATCTDEERAVLDASAGVSLGALEAYLEIAGEHGSPRMAAWVKAELARRAARKEQG